MLVVRQTHAVAQTIRDGLTAVGINGPQLAGKRVLLKPNLVEPSRERPHMTTHPAMIVAAAEVFRGWGAEVIVGGAVVLVTLLRELDLAELLVSEHDILDGLAASLRAG